MSMEERKRGRIGGEGKGRIGEASRKGEDEKFCLPYYRYTTQSMISTVSLQKELYKVSDSSSTKYYIIYKYSPLMIIILMYLL